MSEQEGNDPPSNNEGAIAKRRLTRRQLVAGTAGGLGLLGLGGLVGFEWPHGAGTGGDPGDQSPGPLEAQSFVTRPDLRPPTVMVSAHFAEHPAYRKASTQEYFFLSPRHLTPAPSQPGLMIVDSFGRLVWFHPVGDAPFDLNCQTYRGKPALTWFQGEVTSGYGVGVGKVANASYDVEATIRAGHGLREDLHELNLTDHGTAYITAFEQRRMDLSKHGGAADAKVLIGHAQEIDLSNGKVLFDWDSLSHVPLDESYASPSSDGDVPYDYFHINSVSETPDGNLLISARNTWALYKVDRDSGKILWRLNGKRSDFTMGPGSRFYWQHDSRMVGSTEISLFDDGGSPAEEKQSRALLLSFDTSAMTVHLERAYLYPASFLAANQGSMQVLPDRRVVVGWGNQPYFSEYSPDGALLVDGEFPTAVRSYRAYLSRWVGDPLSPPDVAVRPNSAGGALVYASWNGATKVATWQVLAGPHPGELSAAGTQDRSSFETAIATSVGGPYFAVSALDLNGKELRRSRVVRFA